MKIASTIVTIILMLGLYACRENSSPGSTVVSTDTLLPHAPPADSGLYPVDSSRYHTDTSTQHRVF